MAIDKKFIDQLIIDMEKRLNFINIETNLSLPGIDWQIEVDKDRAAFYKVSTEDIGNYLKMFSKGLKLTTIHTGYSDKEIDVVARFNQENRIIQEIKNFNIIFF